ncbi:MAG TPA: hypothetical protein VG722_10685 [Tepidisphaeraceae bacterium]|nr:hypothetical protein [Tepidisphaeraceae bacterium]
MAKNGIKGLTINNRRSQHPANLLAAALEPLEPRQLLSAVPVQVDDGNAAAGAIPRIASSDNTYVILWQSTDTSSALDYRLFNSDGSPLTDVMSIDTSTNSLFSANPGGGAVQSTLPISPMNSRSYDVAMDPAGDFVVVWSGPEQIYAQQFHGDGSANGSTITVSSSSSAANSTPAVAMDPAGDFTVAWLEDDSVTVNIQTMTPKTSYQYLDSNYHVQTVTTPATTSVGPVTYTTSVVKARRFDATGNGADPITASTPPADATGSTASTSFTTDLNPSVAMDSAGDFVVGWDQSTYAPNTKVTTPAYHYSYHGYTYDNSGHKHSYTLTTYTGAYQTYYMSPTGASVQFQRYNASGAASDAPTPLNSSPVTAITQTATSSHVIVGDDLAVAMDPGGDFALGNSFEYATITTKTQKSYGQTYTYQYYQTSSAITFKRYSNGNQGGAETTVTKTANTPTPQSYLFDPLLTEVTATMNSNGDVLLAWDQSTYDAAYSQSDHQGIFARRYDSKSKAIDSSAFSLAEADGADAYSPAVVFADSATVDVAYSNPSSSAGSIFTVQDNVSSSSPPPTSGANEIDFVQQPTDAVAGKKVSPAVTIEVLDSSGNVDTTDKSKITLTIASTTATDATLSMTARVRHGIATFRRVSFKEAGDYTLEATDSASSDLTATSDSFTITPAAARKLVFTQPPTNSSVNSAIAPPVEVAIEDKFGNVLASDDTTQIVLSVGKHPHQAEPLAGTLTATAIDGIATFSDLTLQTPGDYLLMARSGKLKGRSPRFTVSAM